MSDIAKIDSNFKVESKITQDGLKFYDAECEPFKLHGIWREEGRDCFCRMPYEDAKKVSEGVAELSGKSAGGRVKFVTNSSYVAISCELYGVYSTSRMTLSASAGFDMYAEGEYVSTFSPPETLKDGFEAIRFFGDTKLRTVTINFPYFCNVKKLYIGLDEKSQLLPACDYKISKPVVFYGSSITHGASASRPGCTYESFLERKFDFDYVNLGFAGRALAEEAMAQYISGLDMSLFVYDYDHNAPTLEHLENTHEKMFLTVRKAQPDLPIIIMSRPKYIQDSDTVARLEIIKRTYTNALGRGDKNVYFIHGNTLMELAGADGTIDNCHPTDLGFYSMAKRLGKEIECNYEKIFK